jgi:hypothetical protein
MRALLIGVLQGKTMMEWFDVQQSIHNTLEKENYKSIW